MEVTEDQLLHYGVKGMRWGVRRGETGSGNKKPSKSRQIKEARARIADKKMDYLLKDEALVTKQISLDIDERNLRKLGVSEKELKRARNEGEIEVKKLFKQWEKAGKKYTEDPDYEMSNKMTTGEKWLVGGGIAAYGALLLTTVAYAYDEFGR